MSADAKTAVLVVAAGRGTRAGGDVPKQFRLLGGMTVLERSIRAFLAAGLRQIHVVCHPDDDALVRAIVSPLGVRAPVHGGATRQESVRLGLEALAAEAPDHVLIHDAARPLVPVTVIQGVREALSAHAGVVPALAVTDTLKRATGDRVESTVPREGLWRVQTPQGFAFTSILDAHRAAAGRELTDDAAVAEAAGLAVVLTAGDTANIKITAPGDFAEAERILLSRAADIRTGTGFDVHRFTSGDHVWLCGVRVPHSHGLEGHSDADVGLHALTDAIFGALGAGDIGDHFPPSDPRWRAAASDIFLREASRLVAGAGGLVAHCDVTIICERPRVGPHRAAMVARIGEILGLAPGRVSVKATTTEELGFTGRREGIAAMATATIRLPL